MKSLITASLKKLFSFLLALMMSSIGLPLTSLIFNKDAPAPANLSVPEEKAVTITNGDYYVALNGNDQNDGSLSHPFATIERARDQIRNIKTTAGLPDGGIKVCVKGGEYNIASLVFDSRDSGSEGKPVTYCAYGDSPVVLNGGVTLKNTDFTPVSGAAKNRLTAEAQKKVVEIDLTK